MRHRVGVVDDFDPGCVKLVQVGKRSIGIINSGTTIYAILDVCPHARTTICAGALVSGTVLPCLPGEVRYGLDRRIVRCPWHGYEFDLENDGRCVFSDYRGKLRMYPVVLEGEDVLVEVKTRTSP